MSAYTAELFRSFKHIRIATDHDQHSLADFHRTLSMESGQLELSYDFSDAPLAAARESGAPSYVALFEEEGRIRGTASLTCRRARTASGDVDYAYLADLRIGARMTPALRREWQHFYGTLVREVRHLGAARNAEVLITAVLDQNARAIELLTRRLREVRYVPLQPYCSVTAVAPLPWVRKQMPGLKFRQANPHDVPRIRGLLAARSGAHGGIAEHFTDTGDDEFVRRQREWRGFDVSQFILAEDEAGRVLAVVAPRRNELRTLVVRRAPKALSTALRVARALRITHARVPGPVDLVYLTHFECDPSLSVAQRAELFEAMLFHVWQSVVTPTKAHGVCFVNWPQFEWPVRVLRGWVHHVERSTLYQVVSADHAPSAQWVEAAQQAPLPFELSTS